ncbi:hypothetical protein BU25DRAFT_37668 [Macroventuria anomochaeta]|uniref:Uncharacterized protein n=1 Tax=Macroventuria anomochaeta TaxID=301207 RepID=A0ACB6S4T5_9PLEO|nr:uncharacterized protein BU25DRAFT_37668 [Macroventuria anomochaeta]KAF2628527.1 hypothetical protein BU25DRAFT_37668 [Macroventuria anomochaeta]
MPAFETLPADILFELSLFLDLDDVVHVSQACRQYRALLLDGDDKLARKVVDAHHQYTDEALQARQGITSYREALCAIYDRRDAFSNAQPFSARVVSRGSSFLYRQGVLCVQTGDIVIISNLRSGTPAVQINLRDLYKDEEVYDPSDSYEMMYYSDGILAILVTNEGLDYNERFIRFLSTTDNISNPDDRIMGFVDLGLSNSKVFVRHTADYMYLGTHNGQGSDGHRKWVIKGCSMDFGDFDEQEPEPEKLLLEDFHGHDIGSTVAFEIHNGYFYAVSNQGTYEVEEVDWTSFYHCVRFPLDNPTTEAIQKNKRVYRRQHAEGAIHDSWTNLTLQHDERTNDLYIVESRREWVGASSKQARTFYTSRISFPTPAFTDSSWEVDSSRNNIAPPLPLPDNDILTTVLESSHSANYMPTPKQYSWTRHPEFPSKVPLLPNPRSFILARTKLRAYNLSCSAFLDLVEDEQCCPNRPPALLPCLRLRIGSRRIAPYGYDLFGYEGGREGDNYTLAQDGPHGERVHFDDNTQYRYTPIRMWPPPPSKCACSARLHRIMSPTSRPNLGMGSGQKTITAVCDERSIVYMIKPSKPYSYHDTDSVGIDPELGTIVLVDFGRTPTPRRLDGPLKEMFRWDWFPDHRKRCREGTC